MVQSSLEQQFCKSDMITFAEQNSKAIYVCNATGCYGKPAGKQGWQAGRQTDRQKPWKFLKFCNSI